MGYDRGDSFPHDHIPFNVKGNGIATSFISVQRAVVREAGVSRHHEAQLSAPLEHHG